MPLDEDALRALARLEEQGLTLAKSLRPGEDAVESAFKPPAKTNHSFIPRKSDPYKARRGDGFAPRRELHIPAVLEPMWQRQGGASASDGFASGSAVGGGGAAARVVRRWEALPKHAWLMAAESGQAPGPGYREMSPYSHPREFGPTALSREGRGGEDVAAAQTLDASSAPLRVSSAPPKRSRSPAPTERVFKVDEVSSRIGAHYSPAAVGLSPANLPLDGSLPRARPAAAAELPAAAPAAAEAAGVSAAEADGAATDDESRTESFLPLECFDNGDAEPLDPEAWEALADAVAAGGAPLRARSRYRGAQGGLSWLPCEVVAYDATRQRFELRWSDSGKGKWATRFNVLFDAEDELKFHERVAAAKALRAAVEGEARYRFYATHELPHALTAMRAEVEGAVVARAGADDAAAQGAALQAALGETRDDYLQAMRRATLDYEMHSSAFRATVAALQLPPPPPPPPARELGVVSLPAHSFSDTEAAVRDAHFWADSRLLATFDGVWRETQWLETATLVDDDLTKLDRPCRLDKIVAVQAAQREAFVNRLGGAWVPAVEMAVQTELTGSDEFTQASIGGDRYEGGRLPRVFKQISLAMADALQARDGAPPRTFRTRARHPTPPRTHPSDPLLSLPPLFSLRSSARATTTSRSSPPSPLPPTSSTAPPPTGSTPSRRRSRR